MSRQPLSRGTDVEVGTQERSSPTISARGAIAVSGPFPLLGRALPGNETTIFPSIEPFSAGGVVLASSAALIAHPVTEPIMLVANTVITMQQKRKLNINI